MGKKPKAKKYKEKKYTILPSAEYTESEKWRCPWCKKITGLDPTGSAPNKHGERVKRWQCTRRKCRGYFLEPVESD